jgi:hypothetical protein
MFRITVPVASGRLGWIGVGFVVAMMSTTALYAQQAAAPAQQAAPANNPYVFANDGALLLNFIKPDKAADFDMILGKLKEALEKSEKPERKEQAKSWKIFKAKEAGAGGSVIYVSVIYPAVKGADYTVSTILAEGFPQEANELYKKYAEAFGSPSGNLLNLNLFSELGK